MLMKKKNTFTDFIDCAEHLIAERWTTKDRLVIEGGSAGGLLMGAVTNMRPDLFKAVHAAVPFVDVMNTMMDATLPLTVGEYLEWGNPNEKPAYDYMLSTAHEDERYFFFPGSVGRPFSFHVRIGQNTEVLYPAASAILAACEDDRPVPHVKTSSVSFEVLGQPPVNLCQGDVHRSWQRLFLERFGGPGVDDDHLAPLIDRELHRLRHHLGCTDSAAGRGVDRVSRLRGRRLGSRLHRRADEQRGEDHNGPPG